MIEIREEVEARPRRRCEGCNTYSGVKGIRARPAPRDPSSFTIWLCPACREELRDWLDTDCTADDDNTAAPWLGAVDPETRAASL